MKTFAEIDKENKGEYVKIITSLAKLSGLFSDNIIPYIDSRGIENAFCRGFNARNLSRADGAFDAQLNTLGIGIKTFLVNKYPAQQKIAEFPALSSILSNLKGKELAIKLAEFRNNRIELANRLYNIESSLYHIVVRKKNELLLFETDYNSIDISNIHLLKGSSASLQFEDGHNLYSFNYAKNTLFRKFTIPQNAYSSPVEIVEDPYTLLLELFEDKILKPATDKLIKGVNYVILPLYGIKDKQKFVFENSGLNQWHSKPRPNQESRCLGEIYIPVPSEIHKKYPDFFPEIKSQKEYFNLEVPTGEIFKASMCQTYKTEVDGVTLNKGKGLMTNPNKALSDWLLRKVFNLKEGELATIEKMNELGFDSVIIQKDSNGNYKIDKVKSDSYDEFINNE
jgi:hypothetical protein